MNHNLVSRQIKAKLDELYDKHISEKTKHIELRGLLHHEFTDWLPYEANSKRVL